MQSRLMLSLTASAAVVLFQASPDPAWAQNRGTSAITGQVTSEAEGAMEGVVVTAKKAGAKLSISVITDAQVATAFRPIGWSQVNMR
jgi:hypothetical protein